MGLVETEERESCQKQIVCQQIKRLVPNCQGVIGVGSGAPEFPDQVSDLHVADASCLMP